MVERHVAGGGAALRTSGAGRAPASGGRPLLVRMNAALAAAGLIRQVSYARATGVGPRIVGLTGRGVSYSGIDRPASARHRGHSELARPPRRTLIESPQRGQLA